MNETTQHVEVDFRRRFRKAEVDEYVESVYSHLPSVMGSWHSESTIKTELSRIKVTLRHLFPEDEDEEFIIDLSKLTWKAWLRAFERLSESSTISYGYRVSRFLSLHDPRLAVPVKNAVNYHLAELRGQAPPPLQKIPLPLFPQQEAPTATRLSTSSPNRKANSAAERKFIVLDELLRSLTENSDEKTHLDLGDHQEQDSPSSPFARLREILRRKR
ncbi:MAG: hypothetical protein ACFFB3_00740 [Candidatus Hodarchaeota archaeon]